MNRWFLQTGLENAVIIERGCRKRLDFAIETDVRGQALATLQDQAENAAAMVARCRQVLADFDAKGA